MKQEKYWSPVTHITYQNAEWGHAMEQEYLNNKLIKEMKKANQINTTSNITNQTCLNSKGTGKHLLMALIDIILFIGGWASLLNSGIPDTQFMPIGITGSIILVILFVYHVDKL